MSYNVCVCRSKSIERQNEHTDNLDKIAFLFAEYLFIIRDKRLYTYT